MQHMSEAGYQFTLGEVFRTPEQAKIYASQGKGILHSLHCERLAIDINIFKDGVFLEKNSDYEPLGIYWESLHPKNRWGGRFKRVDSDHFERNELPE